MGIKRHGKQGSDKVKGSVTVEACMAFPVFLCFFLLLIFFMRIVAMDMVLSYAANETAKQLAAAIYPIKFINELEDETFLGAESYQIPSFAEELESIKRYIANDTGKESENAFSHLISGYEAGEVNGGQATEIFNSSIRKALEGLESGVKSYVASKFGERYYEMKSEIKYSTASILCKKLIEGSYLDEKKLELTLVQIPQSVVENDIRSRDRAYMERCRTLGYVPGKEDVAIGLRYEVNIPIPFFDDRTVVLEHIGIERAWLRGGNGIYSKDLQSMAEAEGHEGSDEGKSVEDSYEELSGETVYITNTGQKYHKEDCPCLSASKKPIKLSHALEKGYGKCGVCSNKGKWNFYK